MSEERSDGARNTIYKVCSMCWKKSILGVVLYDSAIGTFSIASFNPIQFPIIVQRLRLLYRITHFLIPFGAKKDAATELKKSCEDDDSIQIKVLKNQFFSYMTGLEALNSMVMLVPDAAKEEARKSIASGIVDISSKSVVGSIGAISHFLEEETKEVPIVIAFKSLDILSSLYLPPHVLEELQIFTYDSHPSIHSDIQRTKEGVSLFSIFNRCSTVMGRLVLRNWFLVTLEDAEHINSRLDIVESFVGNNMHSFVNDIISKLKTLPELRHLLIRMQKETMTQIHWLRFHKGIIQAAALCHIVEEMPLLSELNSKFAIFNSTNAQTLMRISSEIDSTIDLKSSVEIHVRDDFDSQLMEMRVNYSRLDKVLTDVAKKLMTSLPLRSMISALSVVYVPQQGFLTTILKSPSLQRDDLPPGYLLHFETETNFYCKNAAMNELDQNLGDMYQNILAREIRILVALSDKILNHSILINNMWDSIGNLDALCSLSVVAAESNYVRPIISTSDESSIKIVNGRHPILEKCSKRVVPNSTEINCDESRIHIITGPNSSGKSVYLKQVALIVYLAHIGSFVPADEAVIPMIDNIFCLFQTSLSSSSCQPFTSNFKIETRKASEALRKCTSRSLIIIDEFGKTSNNIDGSSLLCGLVKYLHNKGKECPKCFISTHFHSILKPPFLDRQMFTPCAMNVRFLDDERDAIVFLYQLMKGDSESSGSSLGLHCARRAGLADQIVDRAEVVCQCFENGTKIEPNENCVDTAFDAKCKEALSLFFRFDTKNGDPRLLLDNIESIIYGDLSK